MPRISESERAATRVRLIEAAKREFADRGLAGARFDEISLAAGHAKGTIYNYFDSKEALFLAVVGEWTALLVESALLVDAPDCRSALREIVSLDVEAARRDPDLARVVVQHLPALAGSSRSAAFDALASGLDLLASVFEAGLDTGEFASRYPPETLARLFLDMASTLELEALMDDQIIDLDEVVELLDTHFLSGLAA